jgi:hypothetical protein
MWFEWNIWLEKMGRKWMMVVCGNALFQLLFNFVFGDTPQFFQGFFEAIALETTTLFFAIVTTVI